MTTQALSSQVNRTNSTDLTNLTKCYFNFTASGGISPYSSSPLLLNVDNFNGSAYDVVDATLFCSIYPNPKATTTITDSVGCTIIKTT
jgi:hypothetical protein